MNYTIISLLLFIAWIPVGLKLAYWLCDKMSAHYEKKGNKELAELWRGTTI
jgi:hypothetical protein